MKRVIKKFSQYLNENKESDFGRGGSINLVDLLDCYVKEHHPRGKVLVMVDISNPARDLVDGGIQLMVDPTNREIGEAQYDGTYYSELYVNGKHTTEGEDDSWDEGDNGWDEGYDYGRGY
jgi:hypothetical protein